MWLAKIIYCTIVTAMLVGSYFLILWVLGIDITNELKGLGVALWVLGYHWAGVEFQVIDLHDILSGRKRPPAHPAHRPAAR